MTTPLEALARIREEQAALADLVCRAFAAGSSISAIARAAGISRTTVYAILRRQEEEERWTPRTL